MEKIREELNKDEKIKWSHSETKNLVTPSKILIVILAACIIAISALSIPVLLTAVYFMPFFMALVALIGLNGVLIGLILVFLLDIRRKKRWLHMTDKELRNYEETYVLTNKRWFQKNYDQNHRFDENWYRNEDVEHRGELVIVRLDVIDAGTINRYKSYPHVRFHLRDEELDYLSSPLGVDLDPRKDVKDFLNLLKETLNLRRGTEPDRGISLYVRKVKKNE